VKKLRITLLISLLILLTVSFAFAQRNTVVIAMKGEPSKLNPIVYQDTESSLIFASISDPLVELTPDGNYTPDGAVIESYTLSDDGKVYTFHLKKGIKFHNGDDMTAEDVAFTYESFMDETLGSPHNKYYNDIEEVVVVDDYTVEIHLKDVNVSFLTNARLRGTILPKAYIEEVGWQGYEAFPISTGPYKFVEHVSGQRIVLQRFEDYWGDKPAIEFVQYRFFPEMTSAVMALQAKQIDYIAELPADEYLALKDMPGMASGTYPKFEDHRICFNKRPDSVFADKRVRQAVAYAINRYELIALTRGDLAIPAQGRVPSFHEAFAYDAPTYEQDLAKAKELLAEAGYPNGFKTAIYAPSGYQERVLEVQQIQRQLAQIGIECEVVVIEWGTYLDVTAEGEAPMFRERWSASSPSPFSFVENWWTESSWNEIFGTYSNPKVDELISQITKETNDEKRWELYREVQNIAMEDVACYPLYWPINGVVYNDEVNIPEELFNIFLRPIYHVDKWSF
jgi:peptide/nickel transport system substrate-binding protein